MSLEGFRIEITSDKGQVHFDVDYTDALAGCIYCPQVISSSVPESHLDCYLSKLQPRIMISDGWGLAEFSKEEAESLFADVTQDIVTII